MGANQVSFPSHRAEDKLAIIRAAVFERLSVDDIVRELGDELQREDIEFLRVGAVREAVTLQRAAHPREVNTRLSFGTPLGPAEPLRQPRCREHVVRCQGDEGLLESLLCLGLFVF